MEKTQIIKGCKKGNSVAQEALFLRYKDLVYGTSLKYCRNVQEAQDHVHDVFIVLFEAIKKYKPTGSFEGWIKRITIFKAIDKFKKNNIVDKPYLIEEEIGDSTTTTKTELDSISIDFIFQSIHELPEKYRMVFSLYQLDDYSHKEIAQMLSISTGTSKSNLHRAKQILKNKITDYQIKNKTPLNI